MQRDQLLRLLGLGTFLVFAEATVAQEEFGDFLYHNERQSGFHERDIVSAAV